MAYKKTDKLIKYNNQFNKDNYDRISLMIPKGKKELIQLCVKVDGESVNGFINRLIDAEIDRMVASGIIEVGENVGENNTGTATADKTPVGGSENL